MVFQTTNFNRTTLSYYLENLSLEQLCFTPKGFKNNILWNIAHILITEQMLTYGLSDIKLPVDKKFVKMYSKGSFPLESYAEQDVIELKEKLIPATKQTKIDYENGVFKTYNEYPTSAGITLKNIDDALQFNIFHEGIHLGIILSIKKLLK